MAEVRGRARLLQKLADDGACTREELAMLHENPATLRQDICVLRRRGLVRNVVLITAEGLAYLKFAEAKPRPRSKERYALAASDEDIEKVRSEALSQSSAPASAGA